MDFDLLYRTYLRAGFSEEEAKSIARQKLGEQSQPQTVAADRRRAGFFGGLGRGVEETAASYAGGIGELTGQRGLQRFAEGIRENEPDLTGAGKVGRVIGRIGSELGIGVAGGGLAIKGATKIPVVARALAGTSRAGRAAATAAASVPIDYLQAISVDDGALLPGRGGAFLENVALSGAAGALLPAVRRPAEEARRLALPPGSYEMGPASPITRQDRLLPESGTRPRRVRTPEGATPEELTLERRAYGPETLMESRGPLITPPPSTEAAPKLQGDQYTLFSGFPLASIDQLRSQGAQAAIGAGLGAAVGGATAEEGEGLGGAVVGGLVGSVVPSLVRKMRRAGRTSPSIEDVREAANEQGGRSYRATRGAVPKPMEGPVPTVAEEIGPEASADFARQFGERETMTIPQARQISSTRKAEEAVARFYGGQKLDSPDIVLLGDEIKTTADRWKSLVAQADDLEAAGDIRAANALRDSAAENYERLMRMSYASSGELNDAARKMVFQRNLFRQLGIKTDAQYKTLVKNSLGVRELKPSLRAELDEILSIADVSTKERKLAEFAQKNAKTSFLDLIMDWRKSGLLSRPASWLRNFVGSGEGLTGELVETPIASVIDRVTSAATGRERVFGDLGIGDRLATASKGWGQGAQSVWRNRQSFMNAINPEEPLNSLGRRLLNYENAVGEDAPAYLRGAARALQKANNFVYGVIAGGDQPFYQAAMNTSLKERGLIRALSSPEVKSGKIKLDSPEFANLFKKFIDPETADADDVVMATYDALDATFKNSTILAEQIQSAKKRGGAGGRVLEFLIPFPNTPTNIVRKALERVPGLGIAVGATDRARLARHVERMKASGYDVTEKAIEDQLRRMKSKLYAKQITGSAAVYMGYALHKNGILTTEYVSPIGASDQERAEIARRGLTGEGALSLRLGNTSYSLASLGTIAPLLALGAALSSAEDGAEETTVAEKFSTPMMAVGRTILEMPLLTGAREAIETLEGRGIARPAQAGRQLASFIPLSGALTGVARALDVESGARKPETFTEGFLSGMPGLSERAAPRVTALGERIRPVPYNALQALFQPFTARSIATGPIYEALEQAGYYPTAPRKLPGETEAEYSARREQEGAVEREALQSVLDSLRQYPEFSEERLATDPESRELFANAVRRTLSRVRSQNTRLRRAQELAP